MHRLLRQLLRHRRVAPLVRFGEALLFGTRVRGDVLELLLRQYYGSRFRRDWRWSRTEPHFEDHRCFLNLWSLPGEGRWPLGRNPDFLARGLFNRELMKPGDRVLDIGCGDGFFDYFFYSGVAKWIDALDIEPAAIAHARRYHGAPNINYRRADCVKDAFPHNAYDVVIWDGAIGHFSEAGVAAVMAKARQVLKPGGVLAGSEALEQPATKTWDHELAFPELGDLGRFLRRFFPAVALKEIPPVRGRYREALFRCALTREALAVCEWQVGAALEHATAGA